jgi:predicted DCC family thiol-disulfide oxidoreductase YuxK
LFRLDAVLTFIGLHGGFGLTFNIGIFRFLSIFSWLAFLPTSFWNDLEQRLQTPVRQGLKICFDGDCGFCTKVVHILRTLLILPGTPLLMPQEYPNIHADPDIHADMEAENSWVIEDYQGKRHFKSKGIVYVVSLSPVFRFLVPLLNWNPVMAGRTKFYEAITSNRQFAGNFTKPFKFRPLEIRKSRLLNLLAVVLLIYAFIWNIQSYAPDLFKRKISQKH